jgi:hypothetical protein
MVQLQCKWKLGNDGGTMFRAMLFFSLLATNIVLQLVNGSYGSDFGAHPDEGAHVVTSLMVRDYMSGGFIDQINPVAYAKGYYEAFPKVAIGHYPPLFYLLSGAWLVFGTSVHWFLVFSALMTSMCGLLTFLLGRQFMGMFPALMGTLAFTFLPLTQQYTSTFMSDMLLLGCCLLAALAFARFMGSGRLRDSLLFGLVASAAVMTKSSGLLLAFLPCLALLLAGKLHLLKEKAIWMAPVVVGILAMPWIVLTYGITSQGVMTTEGEFYPAKAWSFFSGALVDEVGVALMVLAAIQLSFGLMALAYRRRTFSDIEAVNIAIFFVGFSFYLFVPAGLEQRYLLVLMPSVMLLAFKALERLLSGIVGVWRLEKHLERKVLLSALFACSVALLVFSFGLRPKYAHGFRGVIEAVASEKADKHHGLLVVSDSRGEGALVAASALAASQRPEGGVRVYRGSKRLASSDWLGRNYTPSYETVSGLRKYMNGGGFGFLAVDQGVPRTKRNDYHDLVRDLIDEHPEDFQAMGTFTTLRKGGNESSIILYRIGLLQPVR